MWASLMIVLIHIVGISSEQAPSSVSSAVRHEDRQHNSLSPDNHEIVLKPRIDDRTFAKDIVDRLHALDNDIGKLLFNSTSMYTINDQNAISEHSRARGGERFAEILSDLDALQDEIGSLINSAAKVRQYNMLIRLRPLNTILYRIRHNMHLIRNSLVAINTVSTLERLGNEVLDSTLSVFLQPDANLTEEIGDNGNYDFNLDRISDFPKNTTQSATVPQTSASTVVSSTFSTTLSSTTLSSTTPSSTTLSSTTPSTTITTTTQAPMTVNSTLANSSPTVRPARRTQRPTRRSSRPVRRTTLKSFSSTAKIERTDGSLQ